MKDGYIEMDLMVTVLMISIIVGPIIQLYTFGFRTLQDSLMKEKILQQTITYVEQGKAMYYHTGQVPTGVLAVDGNITYTATIEPMKIGDLPLQRYSVTAENKGLFHYDLATYVYKKISDSP